MEEEGKNEIEAKFQMEPDQTPIGWRSCSLSYSDVLDVSPVSVMDVVQS